VSDLANHLENHLENSLYNDLTGGRATYQSILGPLLAAMWHSQLGVALVGGEVDTWTDQIGGRVVQAPAGAQRPAYAADGTKFSGKNVVKTVRSSSKCLRSAAFASLYAPGSLPWQYIVGRYSAIAGGAAQSLAGAGVNATSNNQLQINAAGTFQVYCDGAALLVAGVADTLRHSFQWWPDVTNMNLSLDNAAPATTAILGPVAGAGTSYGVGTLASSPAQFADASVALILVCSSKPSTAQVAAIEALASSEFPA
jgi:hypothetical protein